MSDGMTSYKTRNLGLAAYLVTHGQINNRAKLKDFDSPDGRINSGSYTFVGPKEGIDQLVIDYATSAERAFDDSMRYLKSVIINGGNHG